MSKLALCAAFGTFASAKSGAMVSSGSCAVYLLTGTVTEGDVVALAVGVREGHSDHLVLHRTCAVGLGVVRETVSIAETVDEIMEFFVVSNDGVLS